MKTVLFTLFIAAILILFGACTKKPVHLNQSEFYFGADLSYVNEMEDCGGFYMDSGRVEDPFRIFAQHGHNLVRVRLWHNPEWTQYSTIRDVETTIRRAHLHGMKVLLDFHYSDDWADPGDQIVPKAWRGLADSIKVDSLYAYTKFVLERLYAINQVPEMVQIGNETNTEILLDSAVAESTPIDWSRNIPFFNAGLKAVADFNNEYRETVKTMIHIAQPENALSWFPTAIKEGLQPFDFCGISYYPKWSSVKMDRLSPSISELQKITGSKVIVVETAYPFTLEGYDKANNLLGQDALLEGLPATQDGQLDYMLTLYHEIEKAGGVGLVYWEPAWISTSCSTRWGEGSHWENSTFFDSWNQFSTTKAISYPQIVRSSGGG